jgi:hypothetical protein
VVSRFRQPIRIKYTALGALNVKTLGDCCYDVDGKQKARPNDRAFVVFGKSFATSALRTGSSGGL